jgi:hypothetical protein
MNSVIKQLVILAILTITACSSQKVWKIDHQGRQGTIASTHKLPRYSSELRKMIPCQNYTIGNIEEKSQYVERVYQNYITSSPTTVNTNSSLHDPMNNNSGAAVSSKTPIFDQTKEVWYEYSYTCETDKGNLKR